MTGRSAGNREMTRILPMKAFGDFNARTHGLAGIGITVRLLVTACSPILLSEQLLLLPLLPSPRADRLGIFLDCDWSFAANSMLSLVDFVNTLNLFLTDTIFIKITTLHLRQGAMFKRKRCLKCLKCDNQESESF